MSTASSSYPTLYNQIANIVKYQVSSISDPNLHHDIAHDLYEYFQGETGARELAEAQSKSPAYVNTLIKSRMIDKLRKLNNGQKYVSHDSQLSYAANDDTESYINSYADTYDLQEEYILRQIRLKQAEFMLNTLEQLSPKECRSFVVKYWYELTGYCYDLGKSPKGLLKYIESSLNERELLKVLTHERSSQHRAQQILFPEVDNDQDLKRELGNYRTAYGRAKSDLIRRAAQAANED